MLELICVQKIPSNLLNTILYPPFEGGIKRGFVKFIFKGGTEGGFRQIYR